MACWPLVMAWPLPCTASWLLLRGLVGLAMVDSSSLAEDCLELAALLLWLQQGGHMAKTTCQESGDSTRALEASNCKRRQVQTLVYACVQKCHIRICASSQAIGLAAFWFRLFAMMWNP